MDEALNAAGVELVCLAGFMRLLTSGFVGRWHDRLINIHPSLLPAFKGLDTHARAIEAGVRFTGCTVHFVRPAMDEGPIVLQAVVPILEADDSHSLADRVLVAEHRSYPLALRLIAEGRARVEGERVAISGSPITPATAPEPLLNPPA
jgi:phosphoribosylglycinamide formyltransferase-1